METRKFNRGDKVVLTCYTGKDYQYLYEDYAQLTSGNTYTIYEYEVYAGEHWVQVEEDEMHYDLPAAAFNLLENKVEPSEFESKTTLYPVNEKVNVINPTKECNLIHTETEIDKALDLIFVNDEEFFKELESLVLYLASTYKDKYEDDSRNPFHPKEFLTKEVTMFNVSKYLRRYTTSGFEKSNNPKDVLKAIHYLLMELKENK